MSNPTGVAIAHSQAAARCKELKSASLRLWKSKDDSEIFLDRPHAELNMHTPRGLSHRSQTGHVKSMRLIAQLDASASVGSGAGIVDSRMIDQTTVWLFHAWVKFSEGGGGHRTCYVGHPEQTSARHLLLTTYPGSRMDGEAKRVDAHDAATAASRVLQQGEVFISR